MCYGYDFRKGQAFVWSTHVLSLGLCEKTEGKIGISIVRPLERLSISARSLLRCIPSGVWQSILSVSRYVLIWTCLDFLILKFYRQYFIWVIRSLTIVNHHQIPHYVTQITWICSQKLNNNINTQIQFNQQ